MNLAVGDFFRELPNLIHLNDSLPKSPNIFLSAYTVLRNCCSYLEFCSTAIFYREHFCSYLIEIATTKNVHTYIYRLTTYIS